MPEDTLRLTTDPGNSFDVLSRLGTGFDRLGQSGARIGEGFVRGERVVRTATQNIAAGLLTAQSGADAAAIAFQSLERVFRIGIVPTIAAAGVIAGFTIFQKKVKESEEAYKALEEELRRPLTAEINLSPEDIGTRIESVHKATDAADKSAKSWAASLGRIALDPRVLAQIGQLFLPSKIPGFALPSTGPKTTTDLQKEATEGRERELKLADAQADAELKRANLKLVESELDKAELILEQKRAALVEESVTKGGNTLNLYKRLLAAQIDVEVAARKKAKEDEKTLDAAKKTTAELEKQNALLKAAPQTAEQKKAQEIQESDRAVANARADQQRIEDQQAEEQRAVAQKKSDTGELQKFGRILSPQERLQASMEDQATERQKNMDAHDKDVQQKLQDQMEEQLRGISPEQLKNERDFNKSRGKEGVSALADQDFSGIASLANQDFSGIASLGGLSISIA